MGARGATMIIGGGGVGAAAAGGGGAAGGGAAMAMGGGGSGDAARLLEVSAGARALACALADVWSCGAAFGVAGTKSGWLVAGGDTDAVIWFFGTGLIAGGASGGACNARNRVTRKPETITMHAAISQPLRAAKRGAGLGRDAGSAVLSCVTAAKTRARRADLSAWSSNIFSASR